MRGIIHILSNTTAVTDLLANGANSIFQDDAPQGEQKPYLIVDYDGDPVNTMSPNVLDELNVRVFSISKLRHTSGAVNGATEISEAVRTALVGQKGIFDGDDIASIDLESFASLNQETGDFPNYEIEQVYQVFKRR